VVSYSDAKLILGKRFFACRRLIKGGTETDVKKVKIIVAIVGGVVILALAGVPLSMAADNTTPTTTPATQSNTLFAKVAALLNVTEQQLTDAFKQAVPSTESDD